MGLTRHYLIIGDVNTADFSAVVDGSNSFVVADQEYSAVSIEGRNGDLFIDNGRYSNVIIPYSIMFRNKDKLNDYKAIVSKIRGYARIEDTHHPEEYRLGKVEGITPSMSGINNRTGVLDLNLNCKPQRFLKSGEIKQTFSVNGNIWNPTEMDSLPLIRVYGYGTLGIGSSTLTITNYNKSYIDIDCDIMDCFNGSANLNKYVTLSGNDFPVLPSGRTGISFSGNITKVEIIPRWWRL